MKRWIGGEFCSEAHRKQYQEDYNQLAVSRLQQAKPEHAKKPPEITKPAAVVIPVAEPAVGAPVIKAKPDPAFTGFMADLPRASKPRRLPAEIRDPATIWSSSLSFPSRRFEIQDPQLMPTAKIMLEAPIQIREYAGRNSRQVLETREFACNGPIIGIGWPIAQMGLAGSEELPDGLQLPTPPCGSPQPWRAPERMFEAIGTELSVLAHLAFRTTGIQDNEDEEVQLAPLPVPKQAADPKPLATSEPVPSVEEPPDDIPEVENLSRAGPLDESPTLLDLALPGLNLRASGSFLTKLPGTITGMLRTKKLVS